MELVPYLFLWRKLRHVGCKLSVQALCDSGLMQLFDECDLALYALRVGKMVGGEQIKAMTGGIDRCAPLSRFSAQLSLFGRLVNESFVRGEVDLLEMTGKEELAVNIISILNSEVLGDGKSFAIRPFSTLLVGGPEGWREHKLRHRVYDGNLVGDVGGQSGNNSHADFLRLLRRLESRGNARLSQEDLGNDIYAGVSRVQRIIFAANWLNLSGLELPKTFFSASRNASTVTPPSASAERLGPITSACAPITRSLLTGSGMCFVRSGPDITELLVFDGHRLEPEEVNRDIACRQRQLPTEGRHRVLALDAERLTSCLQPSDKPDCDAC
jgi:hypothetical protein